MSSTDQVKTLYSAPEAEPANDIVEKPTLRASKALLAFLFFIVGQVVLAVLIVVVNLFAYTNGGGSLEDQEAIAKLVGGMVSWLVLGSVLGGGVGLLLAAWMLKSVLKDCSENGAAWVFGDANALLPSFMMGAGAALFYLLFPALVLPPTEGGSVGLLAKMALQAGLGQIIWVITAVMIAPVIEELLFRGLILGGFSQSFGVVWGVILSTLLFVVTHTPEAMHYLPSFIGLTLLSLIATRQRLKWSSVVAPIAVHVGYNSVLAMMIFFN